MTKLVLRASTAALHTAASPNAGTAAVWVSPNAPNNPVSLAVQPERPRSGVRHSVAPLVRSFGPRDSGNGQNRARPSSASPRLHQNCS
jgi:hypothetical protein